MITYTNVQNQCILALLQIIQHLYLHNFYASSHLLQVFCVQV